MEQNEGLMTLFGGYLNQDYGLDYDDWREAVVDFKQTGAESDVREAISGIKALLSENQSPNEINDVLVRRYGSALNFGALGLDIRDTLGEILDTIAE